MGRGLSEIRHINYSEQRNSRSKHHIEGGGGRDELKTAKIRVAQHVSDL